VDGGFQLAPVGGLERTTNLDDGGVAQQPLAQYQSIRRTLRGGDANDFAGSTS